MHNARPLPRHRRQSRKQEGIVLVIALVMLVVISLASVAIMRNSLSGDKVSDNTRRHTQALQAAQAALRFCENEVLDTKLMPQAAASSMNDETWRTFGKWSDESIRRTVSAEFMTGPDHPAPPANLPQCMAQFRSLGGKLIVVVTARGFSDNYTHTNGRTEAGSVVWLQSILQMASTGS